MSNIKLSIAARCEAAGRDSNEDNYLVISDLGASRMGFVANETIPLGEKGALLVVCDGMGGMNAGEVASEIAVQTVKSMFAVENLDETVIKSPCKYIEKVIKCADEAIKKQAKANSENKGMGTTIALLWLLDGKAFVGWCGDSRVYRYNAQTGIERLSHDHSYVQELVDAGTITEEMAFYHPQNNIITRSLGDTDTAASPETKEFYINDGDWFMLCSDGLCGNLQDSQIEAEMSHKLTTAKDCRDALWKADEEADWHDNVTIIVVEIIEGGISKGVAPLSSFDTETEEFSQHPSEEKKAFVSISSKSIITVLSVLVLALVGCVIYLLLNKDINPSSETNSVTTDSVTTVKVDSTARQVEPIKRGNESVDAKPQNPKKKNTNEPKNETLPQVVTAKNVTEEQSISPDDIVTAPAPAQSESKDKKDSITTEETSKDGGDDVETKEHETGKEKSIIIESTKTGKLNTDL